MNTIIHLIIPYPNELESEFLSLKWRNWIFLAKKLMTLILLTIQTIYAHFMIGTVLILISPYNLYRRALFIP